MSADICSDVTQTVGKDNISASVNPDNQSLSTTHEKTFIPNNIDGNDSRQTTTKEACSNTSQEETENSEPPPPPLGPVRNVQGSRYPTSSQQQYAASGRMNTYSSSCDEEYDPDEASDTFIQVTISDPQKVGEGMSSYMAYRITTKTNLKHFKRNNFTVIRRFSDFLGMHEKISEKHSPLGRIIPPAPEKNLVGSTKVKLGQSVGVPINSPAANIDGPENGANGNAETGREFINQRRLALERFMNRIVSHPVLRRDSDVVEFLESNRDLPRATSTSALSSASVFRFLGRMNDTVNKISSVKMEETDPWYEEKTQQIDNMELQLKKLYTAAETLVQRRNELAISTGAFSQATAALSATEEAHTLSRALAHLARAEEKAEQVHHRQAEADFYHFFELIKDYVALIGAVKDALNERNKAFQNWQHAQSMVIRKKEQKARLEMGGRVDKLPSANEEVVEWENRLEETQIHFNQISRVIKNEIDLFERYRLKDFKVSIVQYMEALMTCQLQLVKHWEEFLPEVKNILF